MQDTSKRYAPRSQYISINQLAFCGFETPFYKQLDPTNRWLVLITQIPWDDLVNILNKPNLAKKTGRPALNSKVLIGAVVTKNMLNLNDWETVAQIKENIYLQYFLGYNTSIIYNQLLNLWKIIKCIMEIMRVSILQDHSE